MTGGCFASDIVDLQNYILLFMSIDHGRETRGRTWLANIWLLGVRARAVADFFRSFSDLLTCPVCPAPSSRLTSAISS